MQHGRTWLSMLLLLFLTACPPTGQKPVSLNDGVPAKIAFDLDRLDDRGLYGPSDGLRSLGYEFCIPAQQRYIDAVHALDPDIKVYRHSPGTSVSLPRDRFWDIQVSKIDSPTRQPLLLRPSCVRAASPHLRKLGAGYAALPQMTGRDFSYAYYVSPLRYRTPDKQCGPGRYRGLTAFASLSMRSAIAKWAGQHHERVDGSGYPYHHDSRMLPIRRLSR